MFQWLRSFDQRMRESIDYAICLNSIGSWEKDLWIHVSKPAENVYIKQIFEVSKLSQQSRQLYIDALTCNLCFDGFVGGFWYRIFLAWQKSWVLLSI